MFMFDNITVFSKKKWPMLKAWLELWRHCFRHRLAHFPHDVAPDQFDAVERALAHLDFRLNF